ncbi:MAG: hypothetical protein IKY70_00655, partial [Bacteroidales bacterium]|nr:hypothetical protein [Bacteroidales bacterium]
MKRSLFFAVMLIVAAVFSSCAQQESKDEFYKNEIAKIISEGEVPLIQLEYVSPDEKLSVQVANPAFYDSVKVA